MIDAVVVGAGPAGLSASYALAQRGVEHVVLERGRVGETWLGRRWDSFRLNTPHWMNVLPGASRAAPGGAFVTHREFVSHLERYVDEFALPVETGVEVGVLMRFGGVWEVPTSSGVLRARTVIAAGGAQNVPVAPKGALHVADYRRPDALADGAVLVVGSGQSGAAVAEELVESGRRVFLATSRVPRVPRRYRGRDSAEWMRDCGMFDVTRADVAGPPPRQPQVSGVRGGHTLSLQQLARDGVTLLGRLERLDRRKARFAGNARANIAYADEASARFKAAVDRYVAAAGLYAPQSDDPADRPAPAGLGVDAPRALDLEREGIGTILWCTGFGADDRWRPKRGPGLFELGVPWLRTRMSGTIFGVAREADGVAAEVARALEPRRRSYRPLRVSFGV